MADDARIEAALTAISEETSLPFMARVRDYDTVEELQAADREAERLNREFAARVIAAIDSAAKERE